VLLSLRMRALALAPPIRRHGKRGLAQALPPTYIPGAAPAPSRPPARLLAGYPSDLTGTRWEMRACNRAIVGSDVSQRTANLPLRSPARNRKAGCRNATIGRSRLCSVYPQCLGRAPTYVSTVQLCYLHYIRLDVQ